MRNLKNVRLDEKDTSGDLVTAIAWDASENGSVVYATGPTASNQVIELKRHTRGAAVSITSWDAPSPLPGLACDNIVLLQHFADTATTCLVLAGGDVVVVREDSEPGQDKIEIVGSVDAGIVAAAWTPGEELLAIVSRADTLILMSREFEPVTDITLAAEDLKASKHVSVGWGKKETQFQGKRAKALQDPTMPESVEEGRLSPSDDGRTTISWRGDGAFVAINDIVSGRRAIRVFTRNAVLDSASEPVDGLESALSWRPSGNLIAGVQRLHDHVQVLFFERNGLRHGQFSLRLSQTDMSSWASAINLFWNIDSTVLAVVFIDRVQLWTMGNYHYYLKQEIMSDDLSSSSSSLGFRWHPEQALQFSLQAKDYLLDATFQLSVTRGSTIRPHDHGIVAVIDGRTLKVTPFKFATVPPPMAFCEAHTNSNILDCSISASGKQLAILTTETLDLYSWDSIEIPQLTLQETKPLSANPKSRRSRYSEMLFPGSRPWTETFRFYDDQSLQETETDKFMVTKKGDLLADQRLLARSCTSYLLTDKYLLFITSQHLLKFVDLKTLEVPGDASEVDERCRTIERGAKLVTVVPSTYAVVLQMPRGNLETIYPRALVLAGIRQHIDELDYRAAYRACRTHQVDMNILHDYKPDLFMASVPLFVEQVKKVSWIDDFLSKLKDDNVEISRSHKDDILPDESETKMDGFHPEASGTTHNGKVNRICDAFLSVLESKASTNLQNIITAHVCKIPPDFNTALQLVADLRQKDTDQAEAAVEHLCFLADTNRLYDAALSLYDLDVALLIAQNSQRDPREYMPFLQSLHALAPLRRRFQIDDHLRHYGKALTSLHALSSHTEVQAYTLKHNLYTTALTLYEYDMPHQTIITSLYAKHLHSQSCQADAAMAYESINDHLSAYPLYALANRWRESLACAQMAEVPAPQLQSLARSLSTQRTDSHDYRSAATIFTDYLSDVPEAARLLCKGSLFEEATYLLTLHNQRALIPEIVDIGLREKSGEVTELLADCKAQLNAQVPRIQELRIKAAEDPLAFFGGDAVNGGDDGGIPDNVSIAPTDASTAGGQSLFTRYSNTSRVTSKTRRREERKRARGKKGSVYEEEYLVNSVQRLVERANDVQVEASRIIEGLLRRGLGTRQLAEALDESGNEIVGMCQKARCDVWGVSDSKVTDSSEERPSGADGVFWESQQGRVERTPPEVRPWDTTGLLRKE